LSLLLDGSWRTSRDSRLAHALSAKSLPRRAGCRSAVSLVLKRIRILKISRRLRHPSGADRKRRASSELDRASSRRRIWKNAAGRGRSAMTAPLLRDGVVLRKSLFSARAVIRNAARALRCYPAKAAAEPACVDRERREWRF